MSSDEHDSTRAPIFERTVTHLLEGGVVDYWQCPDCYSSLTDPAIFDEVNAYLSRLSRKIARTSDGAGFYCVYDNAVLADPKIRAELQKHFTGQLTVMEPLVDWILLVRDQRTDRRPLTAGDTLAESDFLKALEQNHELGERLKDVAQNLLPRRDLNATKRYLTGILDYLCQNCYLIRSKNSSGAVYVATARWSQIYDELEFLHGLESTVPAGEAPLIEADLLADAGIS